MADQSAPRAAKKSTAKKAAASPAAAPQTAPVPVETPPASDATVPNVPGEHTSDTPNPGPAPVELPVDTLEGLLAWVADAGTQDEARARADALYGEAVKSEEFTEAELFDVGSALQVAVYGLADPITTASPTDSTASATAADGPQQVPPTGAVDQTPGAGDATPPPGDGGAPDPASDPAAERAAALAKLTGGMDADGEFSPGGSEDEPAPLPTLTGVEHEWGGSVRYVVLGFLFNAIVDGRHLTAYQGDVVKMTPDGAARGLEHHNIAALD